MGLCLPAPLMATGFPQFDKMDVYDQAEFIAVLVDATQKAVRDDGKADFAAQIERLFTDVEPGDAMSLGLVELERNVARARVFDLQHVEKDPKAERLDVEDALFVTLKKNGIVMSDKAMDKVMDTLANFHPQTYAEFEAKSAAEQRRYIALLVKLAWPDYEFREEVKSQVESHKGSVFYGEDVKHDILKVLNAKFPSEVPDQPGFAEVASEIETEYKKSPNHAGTFSTLVIYLLEQADALTVKRIGKLDERAVVLPDGRHVFPDKNGEFWFYSGDTAVKLEARYQALAQRLRECKESRGIANGEQALAACRDQVGVSTEAPRPR